MSHRLLDENSVMHRPTLHQYEIICPCFAHTDTNKTSRGGKLRVDTLLSTFVSIGGSIAVYFLRTWRIHCSNFLCREVEKWPLAFGDRPVCFLPFSKALALLSQHKRLFTLTLLLACQHANDVGGVNGNSVRDYNEYNKITKMKLDFN